MTVKNNAAISRVINQGGFGCIFYPSLPCKKETKRNSNTSSSLEYVSKLVKKNFSSKNEIRIGKIIQGIPFYSLYYVPVIQSCTASLAKINSGDKIVNAPFESTYVSMVCFRDSGVILLCLLST